jgi:acetolactate decarboxylase
MNPPSATPSPTDFAPVERSGLVIYAGSQKNIFAIGQAKGTVSIAQMSGPFGAYGLGACEALDGEITVFEGRPYVTRVRDTGVVMEETPSGKASFAAWTQHQHWVDAHVPRSVQNYLDLQRFIKTQAQAQGVDTSTAFPFLMRGQAAELKWHINVDRSQGAPITPEIFARSKANYVMRNEGVDIVGFYSEQHPGVFISAFAPAIKEKDVKNAIHIHLVSQDQRSAGHIDDLLLDGRMVLRLPVGP